ncbi:MAG: hypothetical protein K2M49_07585 [Muribaculaceae bacterium]|nr:hypothetical protein [Muribaculaceae bacterium]
MKLAAYIPAALVAVIGLGACDGKSEPQYQPSDPTVAGQRVYFARSAEAFEVEDGVNSVVVELFRPKSEAAGEQRVELETTDPSELFSVPAEVVIPAGSVSAPVEITFNGESLVEGTDYELNIAVSELSANQYAISSTQVTICRANWSEWMPFGSEDGVGTYQFSLLLQGDEYPVRLISRSNESNSNNVQFQLQWLDDYDDPDSWSTFLHFTSADGGKTLTVPEQDFMEDADYGMISVSSLYIYNGDASAKNLSTYDAETGTFTLNLIYYCDAGVFGYGNETFQLDGSAEVVPDVPATHARAFINNSKRIRRLSGGF